MESERVVAGLLRMTENGMGWGGSALWHGSGLGGAWTPTCDEDWTLREDGLLQGRGGFIDLSVAPDFPALVAAVRRSFAEEEAAKEADERRRKQEAAAFFEASLERMANAQVPEKDEEAHNPNYVLIDVLDILQKMKDSSATMNLTLTPPERRALYNLVEQDSKSNRFGLYY